MTLVDTATGIHHVDADVTAKAELGQMKEFNMIRSMLVLCLALSSQQLAIAQSDMIITRVFQGETPRGAMSYDLLRVLLRGNSRELDLSDEQKNAIAAMREEFRKRNDALRAPVNAYLVGRESIGPAESREIARLQTPEIEQGVRELRTEITERVKQELLPHQLELATNILMLERFKRYGIPGLLTMENNEGTFDRSAEEISRALSAVESDTQKEIDALTEELRQIHAKYREKVLELKRKQLEESLVKLGTDGPKVRDLLEHVENIEADARAARRRR